MRRDHPCISVIIVAVARFPWSFVVGFSFLFIFVLSVCGQEAKGLSESDILRLHAAGLSDTTLIHQIQHDGVSFHIDADTTIRLKSAGISDAVIDFLLTGKASSTVAVDPGKPNLTVAVDPIKTLYAQGKYPELCDYLKSQLKGDPKNYRLRTILVGAMLKMSQQADALSELETLRKESIDDPASKAYLERASLLVSSWQKQQEGKQKLLAALQSYSYADADSAVDQLSASMMQKTILHMVVDSYAGMYPVALARTERLQNTSYADKERLEAVKTKIAESEKTYNSLMEEANYFVHGASLYEPCSLPTQFQTSINQHNILSSYVELVSKLTRVAPLSPEVMDLVFHVALFTSNYEDLQRIGDRILRTQRKLRIPFSDTISEYYDVVIDTELHTLSTQPPVFGHSETRCPDKFSTASLKRYRAWPELVSFNLPFDQIKGISQKAKLLPGGTYVSPEYYCALSFEPKGMAPWFALDPQVEEAAGPEAALQADRNLALYILHVIGNPNIKADLVDPKNLRTVRAHSFLDSLGAALLTMNGAGAVVAQQQQLEAQQQQSDAQQRTNQQENWQAMLAHDYSALFDGSVFDGLDKLIEDQ